jgi:hypothetical protein
VQDEDNENFENLVRSYGVQDRGVVFLRFREPEDAAASGAGTSANAVTYPRHLFPLPSLSILLLGHALTRCSAATHAVACVDAS